MKLEKVHENDFTDRAATYGCRSIKFEIEGDNGYPDRIVLCPGGHVFFIEFKRSADHKPEPLQYKKHRDLRALGFTVYVAWSLEQAEDYLIHELNKHAITLPTINISINSDLYDYKEAVLSALS